MFRLVRGTRHILDVLDVPHRDRIALRIHDGAFSAMDLTARHPRTGELLSTVKFMMQTLAAAGELQRDLQRELTYDGLRAAEAKGNKAGRRPVVTAAGNGAVPLEPSGLFPLAAQERRGESARIRLIAAGEARCGEHAGSPPARTRSSRPGLPRRSGDNSSGGLPQRTTPLSPRRPADSHAARPPPGRDSREERDMRDPASEPVREPLPPARWLRQ
ncbi:hypothetical protein ACFRMN_26405 [Streptomyces sp. NPDC056835]|uniref:hypothetical protein n=1 Tax=Streptomyces sp. NPDC056835 TaxID=3345956 RepID=UPI0036A74E82